MRRFRRDNRDKYFPKCPRLRKHVIVDRDGFCKENPKQLAMILKSAVIYYIGNELWLTQILGESRDLETVEEGALEGLVDREREEIPLLAALLDGAMGKEREKTDDDERKKCKGRTQQKNYENTVFSR
jgi:hypothetical protein